jgi:hypothetical protein
MADEGKISKNHPANLVKDSLKTSKKSCESSPPSHPKLMQSRSLIDSYPETRSNSEDFKSRAISFLKSITTGSPVIIPRNQPSPEPLLLIPCETTPHLGIKRTEEEDIQIGKVQAWITSGVIKKSYKHCLICTCQKNPLRPFINLNEYPGRIIPSPIKQGMNEEFFNTFSFLDTKLTLSKLVNLREDLIIKVWKIVDFEASTLALGLTCFQVLLNTNLVNKTNRKLFAAVCLLLAFKFIEENHMDEIKLKKDKLFKELYHMDKHDLLTKKMILEAEFLVYSYLNFSIFLPYNDYKETLTYIKSQNRL